MPPTDPLVITIARDWERCRRGVLWPQCLDEVGGITTEVRHYGVADEIERLANPDKKKFFVEEIRSCDVLIINWDSANGDPDFGADFSRRWFEHRRPERLSWVSK